MCLASFRALQTNITLLCLYRESGSVCRICYCWVTWIR
uniref:Uncharacterized protein n=1 Tax=Arundo donax TaxID=35708 RepID=A0A0A9G3U3_ARUDO